jgi:tetratricopeptide (TPR) repeat protein
VPRHEEKQESLWRLSNLYLTGTGRDPDYPEIIRLLERLVERYPESPLVYGARQRLLVAYENTGDMKKARALYEEQLASDKDLPKSGDYATCFSSMRRASPPRESRKRPGKSTGRSWHSIPRPSPGSWTSCGTTCRHWTNRRRTSAEAG